MTQKKVDEWDGELDEKKTACSFNCVILSGVCVAKDLARLRALVRKAPTINAARMPQGIPPRPAVPDSLPASL